jgi:hypothetical protein
MTERQRLEHELKMVEQNIAHAEKNIEIFSAQVEKQKAQKIEYEVMRANLVLKLQKLGDDDDVES